MLFQKNQKKISSILRTIYKPSLNERDIDWSIINDKNELISTESKEVNEDPRRKRRRSSASS